MSERMNISIPDDLKKRMDKANKTEDVNWSHVAATAFEIKLAELAAMKEQKTMEDSIQRLRASRLSGESEDFKSGFECGQDWAKNRAEWAELKLLEREQQEIDFETALRDEDHGGMFYFFKTAFLEAKHPADIQSFFAEELGENYSRPSLAMVKGFWDGAVKVYNEVKHQV